MSNYTQMQQTRSLERDILRQYLESLTQTSAWATDSCSVVLGGADVDIITGKLELLGCVPDSAWRPMGAATTRWVYEWECVAQLDTDGRLEILQLY